MLITFLIFAGCVFVGLLFLLWRLWPYGRSATSVPGLPALDLALGNLDKIRTAGSLPQFLSDLHGEHGALASFWLGPYLCVSLGSENYIRMVNKNHDSTTIYATPLPLLTGLLYTDADSDPTSHIADNTKYVLTNFGQLSEGGCPAPDLVSSLTKELLGAWKSLQGDDHLPVMEYTNALAVKIYARLYLNDQGYFSNNKNVTELRYAYTELVEKIENLQSLDLASNNAGLMGQSVEEKLARFITVISNATGSSSLKAVCDALREINALGSLLSLSLFYLAKDEKLANTLRKDRSVMNQFLKEVLRLIALVPYSVRILQDELTVLGHTLEPGTVLFSSYCCVGWNDQPDFVDLNNSNSSTLKVIPGIGRPTTCASIAGIVLQHILEAFNLRLAVSEVEETPDLKFGLLATPRSELWIKVNPL